MGGMNVFDEVTWEMIVQQQSKWDNCAFVASWDLMMIHSLAKADEMRCFGWLCIKRLEISQEWKTLYLPVYIHLQHGKPSLAKLPAAACY